MAEQAAVGAGCAMIAVSTLDVASMIYAVDIISGVRIASRQFSTDSISCNDFGGHPDCLAGLEIDETDEKKELIANCTARAF